MMPIGGWIAIGAVVFVLIVVVAIYNGLVAARQRVKESWSDVDTELSRRHDLIPNLVSTVKGYMQHERETLERVTELRREADNLRPGLATMAQATIEGTLGGMMRGIMMRAEAYPDLKASKNFLALQGELANTEDRIAAALRFFNGNVRDLNVKCESFPSVIIANMFGFESAEFFELEDRSQAELPQVDI
ncbi:MAG: LemA family protein [Planctomycetota bacterium]